MNNRIFSGLLHALVDAWMKTLIGPCHGNHEGCCSWQPEHPLCICAEYDIADVHYDFIGEFCY